MSLVALTARRHTQARGAPSERRESSHALHEYEFAVGRDERDGPVRIELAELNALMEREIVELNRRGLAATLLPAVQPLRWQRAARYGGPSV